MFVIFRGLFVCRPLMSLGAHMEDDEVRAIHLTQLSKTPCSPANAFWHTVCGFPSTRTYRV